jgi:hypothetical protein
MKQRNRSRIACRPALVSVVALGTPGCTNATQPATIPAVQRDVARRDAALKYKVFTAGQTPGFLASAGAVDITVDFGASTRRAFKSVTPLRTIH